jgi:2-methylaconitate cis-trans-isomerase PrpF
VEDVDADHTLVSLDVKDKDARVDYKNNCVNNSAAIESFAVDNGMFGVAVKNGVVREATVAIHGIDASNPYAFLQVAGLKID